VLAVSATPDAGVDLHRYVSSDYLRRHPVAAYAVALPDRDGQVQQWGEVTFNGRPLGQVGEGAHAHAIRLPEPYQAADRNDLRFTHHYVVHSGVVAADPSYRIGQTGVSAPVDLEIVSLGRSPGSARIRINGRDVALTPLRGYNVLALQPRTGTLLWGESFDTFQTEAESRRMGRRIDALPAGTLVVATVKTDGGGQLEAEGVRALRSVGGACRPAGHAVRLARPCGRQRRPARRGPGSLRNGGVDPPRRAGTPASPRARALRAPLDDARASPAALDG
jgi:Interleukin-like EMT inducer